MCGATLDHGAQECQLRDRGVAARSEVSTRAVSLSVPRSDMALQDPVMARFSIGLVRITCPRMLANGGELSALEVMA